MGFDDLLIFQGAEKLFDWIDEIDIPIIKGFLHILAIIIFLGVIIWLIIGFFKGHWLRSLVIIGLYLFAELCNLVGGGHSKREH